MSALLETSTIAEAREVALIILESLNKQRSPIIQICAAITSGDPDKNRKRLNDAIHLAQGYGDCVFNQVPFGEAFDRFRRIRQLSSDEYRQQILDEFFYPLFESHIHELWFLPGWEASEGARWEYDTAHALGLSVRDYPEELFAKIAA